MTEQCSQNTKENCIKEAKNLNDSVQEVLRIITILKNK